MLDGKLSKDKQTEQYNDIYIYDICIILLTIVILVYYCYYYHYYHYDHYHYMILYTQKVLPLLVATRFVDWIRILIFSMHIACNPCISFLQVAGHTPLKINIAPTHVILSGES